jgi:sugar lactone lactonase YvrE
MAGEPSRVFYVNADWQISTVSEGQIDFSNGIVLRPDGETLLIAESLQNRVLEFPSPDQENLASRKYSRSYLPNLTLDKRRG